MQFGWFHTFTLTQAHPISHLRYACCHALNGWLYVAFRVKYRVSDCYDATQTRPGAKRPRPQLAWRPVKRLGDQSSHCEVSPGNCSLICVPAALTGFPAS